MRVDALCAAVLNGHQWLELFRLKTFPDAFRAYMEEYGPAYRQALAECGDSEEALNTLAADILDMLEQHWKRERIWNRSVVRQETKQMLVNYLSPMLLELEEPGARTLCAFLRDGWTARRPKETYRIASYQRIESGFKNAIMGIEIGKPKPDLGEDL